MMMMIEVDVHSDDECMLSSVIYRKTLLVNDLINRMIHKNVISEAIDDWFRFEMFSTQTKTKKN